MSGGRHLLAGFLLGWACSHLLGGPPRPHTWDGHREGLGEVLLGARGTASGWPTRPEAPSLGDGTDPDALREALLAPEHGRFPLATALPGPPCPFAVVILTHASPRDRPVPPWEARPAVAVVAMDGGDPARWGNQGSRCGGHGGDHGDGGP